MIVGLHGKMRAGKSTAAQRLALYSPLPVVEVSFAAKLKESAAALLDVPTPILETWKNERETYVTVSRMEWGRTRIIVKQPVRSFLQRYGTEAHREVFGQDFWLDAALPLDRDYDDALYVVTDVRFPNEAERVRDLRGIVVKVVGPETDTGSHASEQDLDCDYTLDNMTRSDNFAALDTEVGELLRYAGLAVSEATA